MFSLKSILCESKTLFYQSFVNHRVAIKFKQGIISITFDDVPRSAYLNAVPILDKYGIKSTFYISSGLSEENQEESDVFLFPDDIVTLHQEGHEIACHTFSHYKLDNGSAEELYIDAGKNVINLAKLLGGILIQNFSYPFGQISFKAKSLLAKKYMTMRSSRPGLNSGMSDLYLLRATNIYDSNFDKKKFSCLIRRAERRGGWLILYTHGVEASPDGFSCTPEQFEWVVQQCVNSSAEVLPVNAAYDKILDL